mmetsp:Transcript_176915/g.561699  ORF Transcript_176915/g.561699 Transcript_176915/m.561699 type:complete len:541 (-) Transcript_176915:289-1911(-)
MAPTKTFLEYQAEKREREWNDKVQAQKASMGNEERVKRATDWKRIGNDKFKAGNVCEARDYYREAIIYVEDLVDARRKERNDLLVPLYCNLAQVYLKLDTPEKAEDVSSKALVIAEMPRNAVGAGMHSKAQFRRGLARIRLEKLDEAREDLRAALKLQPGSEEIAKQLAAVQATLAEQAKRAKEAMGGFLQRQANRDEQRRQADERRSERRALAEQRQQMQTAFAKLSKGSMLYEEREKEMEPVRQKEEEKKNTLELEQSLTNILDESKGIPKTEKFDDFMEKKLARCKDQHTELDQKKKILDKKTKEKHWGEDDAWKGQREDHRRRLAEERAQEPFAPGPRTMWEAKEVARWCEQRLRDTLVGASVDGQELEPRFAKSVLESQELKDIAGGDLMLKAFVTDVLKLNGDASVMRLNPHKPTLHYFDYFLKLEWEVAIAKPGEEVYRTADELITVAAKVNDGNAPQSISKHRMFAGTFKIREFCSEENSDDGGWKLEVKIKKACDRGPELSAMVEALRDQLRFKVQRLMSEWVTEYKEYWA